MITDINSEDRLVQQTFAAHLHDRLGWESLYAYNAETFGPQGTLGRVSERDVVLVRDLRAALARLNPDLPESAREQAIEKITRIDFARSLIQHNLECYGFIRGGGAGGVAGREQRDPARTCARDRLSRRRAQPLPCRARVKDAGRVACRTTTGEPISCAS